MPGGFRQYGSDATRRALGSSKAPKPDATVPPLTPPLASANTTVTLAVSLHTAEKQAFHHTFSGLVLGTSGHVLERQVSMLLVHIPMA